MWCSTVWNVVVSQELHRNFRKVDLISQENIRADNHVFQTVPKLLLDVVTTGKVLNENSVAITYDHIVLFCLATNERRILNFMGSGGTLGFSSALQLMNRLHRRDLDATLYQTVLNRHKYIRMFSRFQLGILEPPTDILRVTEEYLILPRSSI